MERESFDIDALVARATSGRCFVCEYLAGTPDYEHETLYLDDHHVVFLDRYPTMFGRVIVAPSRHLEGVTADFSRDGYLALQSLVYDVAEAMREILKPERVYLLSLGSQAANAHVHWHVAPLQPGLPLEAQQFAALMHENGVAAIDSEAQSRFAAAMREKLALR